VLLFHTEDLALLRTEGRRGAAKDAEVKASFGSLF